MSMNPLYPGVKLRLRSSVLRLIANETARHGILCRIARGTVHTIYTVMGIVTITLTVIQLTHRAWRAATVETGSTGEPTRLVACQPKLDAFLGSTIHVANINSIESSLTDRFPSAISCFKCGFKLETPATLRRTPGSNDLITATTSELETASAPVPFNRRAEVFRHFFDQSQPSKCISRDVDVFKHTIT